MNSRFTAPDLSRPPLPPPADADLVDLRRLLAIARRQFRAAALCTLAGAALGLAWLATATPLYTSTATLFINPLADTSVSGAVPPVIAVSLFDSEAGILQSEKIAADAFATIDPAWLATPPAPLSRLKRLLRPALASPAARRQQLLDQMRARFTVERPDAAFLLDLSYVAPSPERAAAILGAFLDAFRADKAEKRRIAAAQELAAVGTHILELQGRLDDAARAAGEIRPEDADSAAQLATIRSHAEGYAAAMSQLVLRQQEIPAIADAPPRDTIQVVSPPSVPVFDSSPNAARALLLSTLAGAMAGVGLGLLREASERGFRSAGQVRRELGVPCLALLPVRNPGSRDEPFAERAEALRAVKLAIDQALPAARTLRIGFAPVASGDGATTTALSFAALIAAGGAPTLLVDADMRDAGLSHEFAVTDHPGFSDVLDGRTIVPTEVRSGLRILPAGTDRETATAAVALGSAKAGEALAGASTPFEVTVVDLPPLARFVDGRAMARHLDAIVIVARWRRTERRQLRALLAADRDLRRKLVGVILNRASPVSVDRYDDDPTTLDDLA